MQVWSALVDEIVSSHTLLVIAAYVIARLIVRRFPEIERYHLGAVGTLVVGHLIALAIAAVQTSGDYDPQIAELTALACQLLAIVGIATTVVLRALLPRMGLGLPRILIDLITAIGVLIVFIIVGGRAGFSVAGLITTSAVLTAVIGFSLQDTLSNVMGGLSLQLDKSVKVGDWITLGAGMPVGKVTEIRWRYTAIETRNWETVIIPNGTLVKSQVTILGQRSGQPIQLRRLIEVFVDFRTPPTEVIATIEAALRSSPIPGAAAAPLPNAVFIGIKDSFAAYQVRYWLADLVRDDPTDSAVRTRIWFALRRAGIPMAIPASTVFLTPETAEREHRKLERELARRMTALTSVDLFRALPDDVRQQLARDLAYTPFAAGEAVTREGDRDDGLYMLVDGEASVRIGTGSHEVARLGPGQFFGEMSLMTGEARTATVVALSDVTCYRIDKQAFEGVLRADPKIAELIADVLATRKTALTLARDEREPTKRPSPSARHDLLGKIRGFFGLSD